MSDNAERLEVDGAQLDHAVMQIEMVDIDELKPFDKNPRKISQSDFEKLQRSIDEFGWAEPIVANKTTGHIVGGHMRLQAARALQLEQVPVVWVELDEGREAALNIALNKISGEWDEDLLAELLQGLDDDLKILSGFDDEEIAKLQDGWATTADDIEEETRPKEQRFTIDELESRARVYLASGQSDRIAGFIASLRQP